MMDLLNEFIDSGSSEINEEMFKLEQKFSEKFGHGIPREMFPPNIDDEQIKETILRCIDTNKDNLFELLDVKVDEKNIY